MSSLLLIGTDLVYLPRIQKSFEKYGYRFASKVLTPTELSHLKTLPRRRQISFIAGRIAAKEALLKALGLGLNAMGYSQGLHWKDLCLLAPSIHQAPVFSFSTKAQALIPPHFIETHRLSITHDGDYAQATVIAHKA